MPVVSGCRDCERPFARVDRPVKCDGCARRVHVKCSRLSADGLKWCTNAKNRTLKFLCDPCERGGASRTAEIGRSDVDNGPQTDDEPFRENSDLHRIDTSSKNPMDIFGKWYNEHMTANDSVTSAKAFSLATVSKTGTVSCRSLILRQLDEDGFVIMTDGRSRKSKDLAENPRASMVFLWLDKTAEDSSPQTRQVRVECSVKMLDADHTNALYDMEPLFCKIRAQICEQGKAVEWAQLKRDHDQLFEKVIKHNVQLPKPDHVVSYKLVPNVIEFYEAIGEKIGDRLLFVKDGVSWQPKRIAA